MGRDWDMLQLKERDSVFGCVYHVFQAEGLLDHFKLPKSNFKLFIREVPREALLRLARLFHQTFILKLLRPS